MQIDNLRTKIIELEADLGLHHNHLSTHGGNLSKIDMQIEMQLQKILELQTEMQDYKNTYVMITKFEHEVAEVEKRHDRLLIQIEDQINNN